MKRKTLFRLICAVLCLFVLLAVSVSAVDDEPVADTPDPAPSDVSTDPEGLYGVIYTFVTWFFPESIVTEYSTTFSKLSIVVTLCMTWWLIAVFLRAFGLIRRRKG